MVLVLSCFVNVSQLTRSCRMPIHSSLTDPLDLEAIYWTLLWALGVRWPLRLRGELDVLERSRERSDDEPWKSVLEVA